MEVQIRSNAGEILAFPTLKAALDFAKERNKPLFEDRTLTNEESAALIWKISFSLPTGERIRLVFEDYEWVLRQMDDEVEKILNQRNSKIQCRKNPRCSLENGHEPRDPGGCLLRELTGDSW